jgi:hypothetical protein
VCDATEVAEENLDDDTAEQASATAGSPPRFEVSRSCRRRLANLSRHIEDA